MDSNLSIQNIDKTINYIKTDKIINIEEQDTWMHPWNLEKFDDLYNRDERFLSIIIKGFLSWLNKHIVMYNKPINHFVFNTGSSYLYIESNGYDYSWSETSGEDTIYMHLPRCIVKMDSIHINTEELSQPFSKGVYERRSGNYINGYCAEIKRIPLEIEISLNYTLSNFNESIILIQEYMDKLLFQKYFNISYLGNVIECSIEFASDFTINLNEIDLEAKETNRRTIELQIKICTNYPAINERSEIKTDKVIAGFNSYIYAKDNKNSVVDTENITVD